MPGPDAGCIQSLIQPDALAEPSAPTMEPGPPPLPSRCAWQAQLLKGVLLSPTGDISDIPPRPASFP